MVSFEQFKKMDIRTGKVLEVEAIEGADKLYLLTVDIGTETRRLVAGIKTWYKRSDLIGKNVVVLANLEPKLIKGIESKGMILAVLSEGKLALLTTDGEVSPGASVS